jgi:hypothetical protein
MIFTNGMMGRPCCKICALSFGTEWRLGHHDDHGYESETIEDTSEEING